jgi:hypothetical protein
MNQAKHYYSPDEIKAAIAPYKRKLLLLSVCMASLRSHIEDAHSVLLVEQLIRSCLARQWEIDPHLLSAALDQFDKELSNLDWTMLLEKSGGVCIDTFRTTI